MIAKKKKKEKDDDCRFEPPRKKKHRYKLSLSLALRALIKATRSMAVMEKKAMTCNSIASQLYFTDSFIYLVLS